MLVDTEDTAIVQPLTLGKARRISRPAPGVESPESQRSDRSESPPAAVFERALPQSEGCDAEQGSGSEFERGVRRGRGRRALVPRLNVEEIVLASKHLAERDHALVRAVYERGLALKAIAAINQCCARRLHARLRAVVRRLRSPLFREVLRLRNTWPADRRAIAEAVVLQGRPQRMVASELGVSLHRVRMEIEHLKALAGVEWERGSGVRD